MVSKCKDGRNGVNGKYGKDGLNEKDGRDGLNGKMEMNGLNGKDGRDGEFENIL